MCLRKCSTKVKKRKKEKKKRRCSLKIKKNLNKGKEIKKIAYTL